MTRRTLGLLAVTVAAAMVVYGCVGDDAPAEAPPSTCVSADCLEAGMEPGEAAAADGAPATDPLTITSIDPPSVYASPSSMTTLTVTIDRSKGVNAPVTISIAGLPAGVTAAPLTIAPADFTGKLVLTAAANAAQQKIKATTITAHADTGESAIKDVQLGIKGINGAVDLSFGDNGKLVFPFTAAADQVACMAVDAAGLLYLAGTVPDGANLAIGTARFTADGVLDTTWGTGGKAVAKVPGATQTTAGACMLDAAGKLVVVGGTTATGGEQDMAVTRLLTTGAIDTTFGTAGYVTTGIAGRVDVARGVAPGVGGDILVSGATGNSVYAVRLGATGIVAASLPMSDVTSAGLHDFGPLGAATGVAAIGTNALVLGVAGPPSTSSSVNSAIVFPLTSASFGHNYGGQSPPYFVTALSSAFDGGHIAFQGTSILLAGSTTKFAMLRVKPQPIGTYALDTAFNTTGTLEIPVGTDVSTGTDVAFDATGRILFAGTAVGDARDFALLRLSADGVLDTTFGTGGKLVVPAQPSADDVLRAMAVLPDGRVMLAGETKTTAGSADWAVVRVWP